MNPESENRIPWSAYLLLAGLSLGWGMAWPLMKIALSELSPWSFRSVTLFGGGCVLLIMGRLGGNSLAVSKEEVRPLLWVALINITGWHVFSAHGISLMQAGRASIIGFTMPIWATLLSVVVLKEQITLRKWLGVGLGCLGLFWLVYPQLGQMTQNTKGMMLMFCAAIVWACGSVLIKYHTWKMPTTVFTGYQLLLGAIPIIVTALFVDSQESLSTVSALAWFCVAVVVLVPIAFCHWAWITVVRLLPAHMAACGTLSIPVISIITSAIILGEKVRGYDLLALLCVVCALALVLRPGRARRA